MGFNIFLRRLLLFIFLSFNLSTYCQKGVVGSGGEVIGSSCKISYTLGQSDYIMVLGNNSIITEGIQQNYTLNTSLPVELLSFNTKQNNNSVDIIWETSSEINNDYFLLEKSTDSLLFYELAKVKGHGSCNNLSKYSHKDSKPNNGINYYRLKQYDYNGHYKYSQITSVFFTKNDCDIAFFPNPFRDKLNIAIKGYDIAEIELNLIDATGKIIYRIEKGSVKNQFSMEDLADGVYLINILFKGEIISRELVIKQNAL